MADWYCKIAGKLYGPFDSAKLRNMAAEGRLLPDDLLRDGTEGDWFPADEIENLFPNVRRTKRDEAEDDDDDWPRRRKKGSGKSINYYRGLMRNLQEFGNWTQYIGWTAVFEGVLRGVTSAVMMVREFEFDAVVFILSTLAGAVLVLVYCFVDALLFGIPCVLLGVRLDPRRHHVLDLFGYAYVVGLAVVLFRLLAACLSTLVADLLLLLIPFLHAAVFGYLLHRLWDLPGGKAWALAGIRFVYQMLFIGAILCVRYLVE